MKYILEFEKVFKPENPGISMKREVSVSVFAILIVLAAFFVVFYLNVRTTGFAVYQQDTQAAFDEGSYSNVVYDGNASAIVLAPNQTAGSYTSKLFDSGDSGTAWNNLTWQGAEVTFEVRNCATVDCSDANFSVASNLDNLSLSGQYFQYRATFDSSNDTLTSAAVDYTVPVAAPVCTPNWGCESWSECAGGQQTRVCTDSNSCGINTDKPVENRSCTVLATEEEPLIEEAPVEEVPVTPAIQVSLGAVADQEMLQGSSKELILSVQNSGTNAVTSCVLSGDDSGFLTVPSGTQTVAPGTTGNFGFSVNVPSDVPPTVYTLSVSLTCAEVTGTKTFEVDVEQKKIDFNITEVQRTREDRVSVDYTITELVGENQDLQIYFSIKDAAGTELANASQNRSVSANETDDFRTNIPINETLNGTMTLSVAFNSQTYSSSVLEPITLGAPTGAAILGGVGAGSLAILVVVALALAAVFFVARKMRQR